MADAYLQNLNERLKAGNISSKDYTEEFLAYTNNKAGIDTKKTINFDMWSTGYVPRTQAEKDYMTGSISQSQYQEQRTKSPLINQELYAIKTPVVTVGGSSVGSDGSLMMGNGTIVTSGQEDSIKKTPWALIIAVIVALIFID